MFNNNTQNSNGSKSIDASNLKVIQDQLHYEYVMNKKTNRYVQYCNDQKLKSLCSEIAQTHKQNFNDLLNYLNSHQ